METIINGHQLRAKERAANLIKSDLEDFLAVHMQGEELGYVRVVTGDEIYQIISEAIEKLNDLAYHEKEEFERRRD